MRTNILFWALASGMVLPAGLYAQDNVRVLSHHSVEAVDAVLAHQVRLQLSSTELERLKDLHTKFDREQTRLVRVGWRGAPGKTANARYERRRVPARPDQYIETRTMVRISSFDRVPGKTVPRVRRTRVTRLVEPPCPFAFLAGSQMEQVHGLLAGI